MYSVIITPLTVRRANSHTWLSELNSVVCVVPKTDISTCDITASKMEGSNDTNIIVKNANKTLNNNINHPKTQKSIKTKGRITSVLF